ncbi:MAG: sarcosine oxidase subunit gamma [Paracoccaceae bacterium]|uniref:sarcosine oxidase subunit gamma n=1 Tax=Seohaeicola saemankumensis TaxID=481181 RepID=UPI001E65C1E5|nr:sarcosine oxidase subunit gamma [Seohaeicola saemankumensis]
MADPAAVLKPLSPFAGLLPSTVGNITLSGVHAGHLTLLAPLRGKDLAAALKSAHGMALPAAGRSTGKDGARAIWFGHAHILLMGPVPDPSLAAHAAVTDISDGWAVARLEGAGAADVLARLVPIDLRAGHFKRGHTARTELAHMHASITRLGETAFQIMVFRSMARTMSHDLVTAMEGVAARA